MTCAFLSPPPPPGVLILTRLHSLSFYKEELAGETVNRVSLLASCRGISKIQVLKEMSHDAGHSYHSVLSILDAHPEATLSYKKFAQGYVGFHAGLRRYRLDELQLLERSRQPNVWTMQWQFLCFVLLPLLITSQFL